MPPRTPAFCPTGSRTRTVCRALPVVACALLALPDAGRAQIVSNGSFESPAIPANSFCQASFNCPGISAWTFGGRSGVYNGNGGAYSSTPGAVGFGAPSPPDGQQAAFVQSFTATGLGPGRLSQAITLATAGTYRLTFFAAGRRGGTFFDPLTNQNIAYDGNTIFDALLGTTTLGTFTTTDNSAYSMRTATFTAAAGSYTLAFAFNPAQPDLGSTSAEHDFFLDAVQITPLASTVPEPGTWGLVGAGLAGLGVVARRRARA